MIGQNKPQPLIKAGYLPLHYSKYYAHGYSLHVDYESNFRNAAFLSQGLGYDFVHSSPQYSLNVLRYNLKFYPFYWMYNKRPYRGLYFGISPTISWNPQKNIETGYGLVFVTSLGAQFLIKDRVSLSFDMNIHVYKNLNDNVSYSNENNIYFDGYYSFKIGLKLGTKKK